MNPHDEVTPWFNEFGEQETAAIPTAARSRWRVPALIAGGAAIAVLAAGGTWLALRQDGSPGNVGVARSSGAPGQGAGSAAGSASSSSAAPSGDGAQAAAALPRCHTGDLEGRLEGSAGGGAAGSVYLDLGLTNHSSHACRVYGFPGMTLIDGSGRWISTTVHRDTTQPKLFTLAPGQAAWAVVHYSHIPADGEGMPCLPGAVGLAVTPPDETSQLTIHAKLDDICQHAQLTTSVMSDKRGG